MRSDILHRNGKSRCFILSERFKAELRQIIFDIDPVGKIPKDWITNWNNDADDLVDTGDFNIDIVELVLISFAHGIPIIILSEER